MLDFTIIIRTAESIVISINGVDFDSGVGIFSSTPTPTPTANSGRLRLFLNDS